MLRIDQCSLAAAIVGAVLLALTTGITSAAAAMTAGTSIDPAEGDTSTSALSLDPPGHDAVLGSHAGGEPYANLQGDSKPNSEPTLGQVSEEAAAPPSVEPAPAPEPEPVGPEPEPEACQGVSIAVGQSIQTLVDQHPAGTTFCLEEGVHRRQSVRPKDGNTFAGPATLDGEDTTIIAFHPTGDNVAIRDLVLERYANPAQVGVIHGGGHQASDSRYGWVVERNEVRYNAGLGIRIGHRMIVRGNNVHHNRQLGIGGIGDSTLVEGNVIAYNNYNMDYDPGWEAGGTKFVLTHDLVVRGNHSHHNNGPGLWSDISNMRVTYEDNLVEDNLSLIHI